jgi:hypothetical protein
MNGKGLLVVVLAAVAGILAKSTFDRAPAAAATDTDATVTTTTPTSSSTATIHVEAPAPAHATTSAKSVTATTAPPTPAALDPSDPIAQLESDFPGAFLPPLSDPSRAPLRSPVRVVLASLPNPLATGFAADFDRGIESIERSAQSVGYVIQRSWFPWSRAPVAADKGKPGWLLFRRDEVAASIELLLVVVASESPASGIDKDELQAAFKAFGDVVAKSHAPSAYPVVPLLGPYFSGSAVSLVEQLRLWCGDAGFCRARKLVVVSGSATRRLTQPTIESLAGVFAGATFKATVLPDDLLVAGMHRFIENRLSVDADNIADLTESGTAYGSDIEMGVKGEAAHGIKIPSPLSLGLLTSKDKTVTDQPRLFDDGAIDKVKLQLESTFATLSRRGVNDVGIVATTTQDKIFLAQQFLRAAPDLRVHTYEGSIDLADPALGRALEGVMVASSYPLFPATQLWHQHKGGAVQTSGALVQFPSMGAEGIYNAALVLLAQSDPKIESHLSARLLDYVSPFCSEENKVISGPSAWISVSIAGQLWPLAVYPPNRPSTATDPCSNRVPDPYVYSVPDSKAGGVPEPRAELSSLTIVGVAAMLILIVGNLLGFGPTHRASYWRAILVTFNPDDTHEHAKSSPLPGKGPEHRVAVAGLWALAITAVSMGQVLGLPSFCSKSEFAPGYGNVLAIVLVGGAFALVGASAVIAFAREWRSVTAWAQGAAIVGLALAEHLLPPPGTCAPDGRAYFFFIRAMDPGVGLTPTIPLFMVGMATYWVCLQMLLVMRRARTLQGQSHAWEPTVEPHAFKTCSDAMKSFALEAEKSMLPACAVGVALGFLILYLSPLRLGSLEGRTFDLACSLCFSLVLTLTLVAAWRAHSLWHRLRDFTRALAIHPASAALERLPDSVAQRFHSPVPGQVGGHHIEIAVRMKEHAYGGARKPTIGELFTALEPRWFPLRAAPGSVPMETAKAEIGEDILALRMADALGLMCDATRTMLFIATGTGLVALFGYALYPFQPAATLTGAGLVSVGIVVIVALRLLLGIERDPVLSHVAGTNAGEITPSLGLVARLVGYVVIPLGGLIGSRLGAPGAVISIFKDLANTLNR